MIVCLLTYVNHAARERVHVKGQQISAQQKAKHRSEGRHAVHTTCQLQVKVKKSSTSSGLELSHQYTLKNSPFAHGRPRKLCPVWTVDFHRNRVTIEPPQTAWPGKTLRIYFSGSCFPCEMRHQISTKSPDRRNHRSPYRMLCGANGGLDNPLDNLPKPMSCSRTETSRQMLSDVLLSSIRPGFCSPVKCGTINTSEPIPMITAPANSQTKAHRVIHVFTWDIIYLFAYSAVS